MSFPRHEGIFRSDGRGSCRSGARSERLHAPTHRLDEFPTGYSSAGWSPPEPASASPAEQKFTMKAAPQPSLFQRMGKPCLAGCLTTGVHPIMPPRIALFGGLVDGPRISDNSHPKFPTRDEAKGLNRRGPPHSPASSAAQEVTRRGRVSSRHFLPGASGRGLPSASHLSWSGGGNRGRARFNGSGQPQHEVVPGRIQRIGFQLAEGFPQLLLDSVNGVKEVATTNAELARAELPARAQQKMESEDPIVPCIQHAPRDENEVCHVFLFFARPCHPICFSACRAFERDVTAVLPPRHAVAEPRITGSENRSRRARARNELPSFLTAHARAVTGRAGCVRN